MRVLDIGCGTADIKRYLMGVSYVGFDPSPDYIDAARLKYPESEFHVGSIDRPPSLDGEFDIALAIGVLHHVANNEAAKLFRLADSLLGSNGKLITVDPVVVLGSKRRLANLIAKSDRGCHVRTHDGYLDIAQAFPREVTSDVRDDLIRLPYNHCVLVCG